MNVLAETMQLPGYKGGRDCLTHRNGGYLVENQHGKRHWLGRIRYALYQIHHS
jgi:hypothetical protein